jgi:hypothetical protein
MSDARDQKQIGEARQGRTVTGSRFAKRSARRLARVAIAELANEGAPIVQFTCRNYVARTMCSQSAPMSIICLASSAIRAKSHDSSDGQMMGLRPGGRGAVGAAACDMAR